MRQNVPNICVHKIHVDNLGRVQPLIDEDTMVFHLQSMNSTRNCRTTLRSTVIVDIMMPTNSLILFIDPLFFNSTFLQLVSYACTFSLIDSSIELILILSSTSTFIWDKYYKKNCDQKRSRKCHAFRWPSKASKY